MNCACGLLCFTADMKDGKDTVRILLLSSSDASLAAIAWGFVRLRRKDGVECVLAGMADRTVQPDAARVMAEVGIDISSAATCTLGAAPSYESDIVLCLSGDPQQPDPLLSGHPLTVSWNVPDPVGVRGDPETVLRAFRRARDELRRLVDDFFERGYFSALATTLNCSNVMLANISDGIIAHDLKRRVFFFNKAAERITGYGRDDVLNRDCHDVFPGNLCGGKCRFCDGTPLPDFESEDKRLELTRKNGERRMVDMTTRLMFDPQTRQRIGVITCFRDLTHEHNLARRLGKIEQFSGIIGRDPKMLEVFDLIRELANSDVPVMIHGESGTGKELVAAAIHNEGPRAGKLFIPVNCGALPEALLESELFGHVRGAFTGAIRDKKGRFELADGGTILLDEIGDISLAMQVKLLRVLQEGRFERVGSESTIQVDVRVISATNKLIDEELATRRFREDLFYRLSVVPIHLPPLRERRMDIPLLVNHILLSIAEDHKQGSLTVSPEAMEVLISHDWPGNVRELQNWLQFSLVKCKEGVILPSHLPPHAKPVGKTPPEPHLMPRHKLDAEALREALRATGGNKREAAKRLGVSRATLYRFIEGTSSAG